MLSNEREKQKKEKRKERHSESQSCLYDMFNGRKVTRPGPAILKKNLTPFLLGISRHGLVCCSEMLHKMGGFA